MIIINKYNNIIIKYLFDEISGDINECDFVVVVTEWNLSTVGRYT